MHKLILGGLLLSALVVTGCNCSRTPDGDPGADTVTTVDDVACTPDCLGKTCGDDGCGGTCGNCGDGEVCTDFGQCTCVPHCEGKVCGSDGCGGSCGDCGIGHVCEQGGCVLCVPDCKDLECGDDGCGGSCGDCPFGLCKQGICTIECDFLCDDLECGPAGPEDVCDCGKCKADHVCQEGTCIDVSCDPDCTNKECGPDGCDGTCGDCPGVQDACVEGTCVCQPQCEGKVCGDDGCEGTCGECPDLQDVCIEGECVCDPDCTDKECGTDGCGNACGECLGLQDVCVEGVCVCQSECLDKQCGDNGCGGTCGECPGQQDVCAEGTCVCVPDCEGKTCGDAGCGFSCGECPGGLNACVDGACTCQPLCAGKECGDDGCGGTCGECPGEQDECEDSACLCKSKCGDAKCGDIGENGANCMSMGVCAAGGVTAACVELPGEGLVWFCYYDEVLGYDGPAETTCDGLDNDCDGLIDEDLDWETSNACSSQGVCNSPLVDASCEGADGWYCLYHLIEEYEIDETLCDQLDNDCDGSVDESTCGVCEPCMGASDCASGVCSLVPSGEESYCSYNQSYCVFINPFSKACDFEGTGEAACADAENSVLCVNGTWFDKAYCYGITPACWEGDCQACVPGSKTCDGNAVKECNPSGTGWDVLKICALAVICIGNGTCAIKSEFDVSAVNLSSQQGISVSPKVVSSASGGFVAVYTARSFPSGSQTDILWRQFSSQIVAVGVQEEVVNNAVSGEQEGADIDNFPRDEGGYVVVWQDTNAPGEDTDEWDVVAQILPEAGPAALPDGDARILVNASTTGSQTSPSVVCMADGTFMVVWEQLHDGAQEPEIYAQRFGPDGSKSGGEFQLNSYVPDDQRYPVLSRLSYTGVIAAWGSNKQENSWDVFTQRLNASFVKDGSEALVNVFTNSLQNRPAVAGFAGTKAGAYVIAWESFGNDAGSLGVVFNLFDKNGDAVYPSDSLVNKMVQSGAQRDPAVAVLEDNHFVVVWETPGLSYDDDQEGIAARTYDVYGLGLETNEFLVNEETIGKQINADVAALQGNGYVVVWLTNPGGNNYSIKGRVFKVDD